MKKTTNLISAFGLLIIILLVAISACKKDTSPKNVGIVGKWQQAQFKGTNNYEFRSDQTFKYYTLAIDSVTKKVLGYRTKIEGKYSILQNDSLRLYAMVAYSTLGGNFTTEDKLQKINSADNSGYRFSINDKTNQLSLFFKCPDLADCVPSPMVYIKQ